MLSIRPLKENDYDDTLVGWWSDWGWTAPMRDFLPQNGKGGLMVMDGDTPVCAGFIYATNSLVSWVDWIISNKNYRIKPNRTVALKMLIDSLTNISRASDNRFVYALIKHPHLIKLYEESGYIKGDSYTSEMIKAL